MEENSNTSTVENKPVDIIAPSAGTATDATKNEDSGAARPEAKVTLTVESAAGGDPGVRDVVFHTPTLLSTVSGLDESCHVKLTVVDPGKTDPRTLVEGTKAEVVAALEKSIVPAEHIAGELRKFVQFLLDHSNLKAIGCHAVCTMDDGKEAGFGFAATAPDCTISQAVALVNCGDANMDEFVTKAKLSIPGRNGAPAKGTVVEPTPEQVEQLG